MKILSDLSLSELALELNNFPKFRAKQIFDCILQAKDFLCINIFIDLIHKLSSEFFLYLFCIFLARIVILVINLLHICFLGFFVKN